MTHLVLLGDSIFDNAAYVEGGLAVIDHVRLALDVSTQPDFDSARKKHMVKRAHPACIVTAVLIMQEKSKVATVNRLNQLFKVQRQGRQMQMMVKPAALVKNWAASYAQDQHIGKILN